VQFNEYLKEYIGKIFEEHTKEEGTYEELKYKLGIALIEPDFDRHRIIELMKLRGGHIKS
jgi:hypothetical protein